jgi:hypothetical protein
VFGHIATVVAVEPGRYEVVEQNFLDFDANLEAPLGDVRPTVGGVAGSGGGVCGGSSSGLISVES